MKAFPKGLCKAVCLRYTSLAVHSFVLLAYLFVLCGCLICLLCILYSWLRFYCIVLYVHSSTEEWPMAKYLEYKQINQPINSNVIIEFTKYLMNYEILFHNLFSQQSC